MNEWLESIKSIIRIRIEQLDDYDHAEACNEQQRLMEALDVLEK